MTKTTKNVDRKILDKLAELAGEKFNEDEITREGTKLVIPSNMTPQAAVKALNAHIEQQETVTSFSKTFSYRPWDGALAFQRAVKRLTGTTGIGKSTSPGGLAALFGGSTPPQLITIPTGLDTDEQVPWGGIEIPLFEGEASLDQVRDRDLGWLFYVEVEAKRKYRAAIQGLFLLIQEELEERSIYRGQAFDGQDMPNFIDLRSIDESKVVYSDDVMIQLDANLWSLLEHSQSMRDSGLPLKRAVLLHGPYGTGKTLAAFMTAKKAIENDWTFVYCRPGKDNLEDVMQTARLYQPSVVFFEDVDVISDATTTGRDTVSRLLDVFDGIQAKGTELVAVLTTNHPEKIHKGMVRPGRLDSVIEVGALDQAGVGRMITALVPEKDLDMDIDLEKIYAAMEGFLPAFVKEAIDRAIRYSISRNGGKVNKLGTDDFVYAANGLRPQLEMMHGALENTNKVTIETLIAEASSEWVRESLEALKKELS